MENYNEIKKKTFSGVLWRFGERILAKLVSFVVSVVLARILMPDEYGLVALCMVFISLCNVFVTGGFGSALIQKKDADKLDFSSVLFGSFALSCVLYLALFFAAPYISMFFNKYDTQTLTFVIRILGLRLPIASINSVQQAYVSRQMIFRKFFLATLLGTILSGIIGIWMAYSGFGIYALVAQYMINVSVDTVVLGISIRKKPILSFSFQRLKILFSFGWKLLVSSLLETGYQELHSLVIGKKYTSSDLAFYEKSKQFPSLIVTNVDTAITGVLFPVMSKMQDDRNNIKKATRRSIKICSYIMFPLLGGMAAVATPMVRLLLTDKWLECVPYIRILCIYFAFYPVHSANLQAINAMGKSDIFLTLEIIKKGIGVIILIISMNFGVIGIAVGTAVSTIVFSFINAYPNKKLLDYSYREQIADIMPTLLTALFMSGAVYCISLLNLSSLIMLLIQIPVGVLIYLGLSKLLNLESGNYIISIIKSYSFKKHQTKKGEE